MPWWKWVVVAAVATVYFGCVYAPELLNLLDRVDRKLRP